MKFYAVKKGRIPGIYRTWVEAKAQVDGFSGAEYKSFEKITDATSYMDWTQEEKQEVMQPAEDNLKNAIEKVKLASKNIKNQPANSVNNIKEKKLDMFKEEAIQNSDYYATVYTDGGSRNTGASKKGGKVAKTDKAAWAYLIEYNDKKIDGAGGELGATNNKMEMTAFINAMKKIIELGFNEEKILFCLDSQYVINGTTEWMSGWKKRGWKKANGPLLNKELWQEIDQLVPNFPNMEFQWVKGHAGQAGNEYVDSLLNEYMDKNE